MDDLDFGQRAYLGQLTLFLESEVKVGIAQVHYILGHFQLGISDFQNIRLGNGKIEKMGKSKRKEF